MAQATFDRPAAVVPTFAVDQQKLARDLNIRRAGRVGLFAIPIFGYFFLWIPIVVLIAFSFNDSSNTAQWRGFTTRWYEGLINGTFSVSADGSRLGEANRFNSETLIQATGRSLFIAFASTVLSTLLGTTVAIGLERYRFVGRRFVELILYLPVVVPEITMGLSLLIFFGLTFRTINGIADTNYGLSMATIIIGHVVFCMPFVAIVVRARVAGMPKSYEEAARDLGANEWRTFTRVTLPLLLPGIVAGALLAFTLSLDDFIITFFTSGPGTTTLPLFVYGMIKFRISPDINAISTIMVLISMTLVIGSLWLQRERRAK